MEGLAITPRPVDSRQVGGPGPADASDAVRPVGDKKPETQMPVGKKTLACMLGLNLTTATDGQLSLLDQIYTALEKGEEFKHPSTGQVLINKGGKINLDEPMIGMSDFQILASLFMGEDRAKSIQEYNATMTLGNQGRDEPNYTDLRRMVLLYKQCEIEARMKSQNPVTWNTSIVEQMNKLLTSEGIKFMVVGGNGEVSKSFLDYYDWTNPDMNKIIKTVMEVHGVKDVSDLKANIEALKALDQFIGQILRGKAQELDTQEGTTPKYEGIIERLLKQDSDKKLFARLGASAAQSLKTGTKLDIEWLESPDSVDDVINQSVEQLFGQMNQETRSLVAKRLGIEGELTSDKLLTFFKDNIWSKLLTSERREIERLLGLHPESRKDFLRLMERYLTTVPMTQEARTEEAGKLQVQIGELQGQYDGVDKDTSIKTPEAKPAKQKQILAQMESVKQRQELLRKEFARSFYEEFLGIGTDKVPKSGQEMTLQSLSGSVMQDQLSSMFGPGGGSQ